MADSEVSPGVPDGSALPWILDHYLRYPGSYEIPLRTMYSLNCKPTGGQVQSPPQVSPSGKPLPEPAFSKRSSSSSNQESTADAAAEFKAQLVSQIARLPSQPCSLPPSFITSFLRRCFAANLEDVDFPQALTGLDYLKDLENRRRKEVVEALRRLGIDRDLDGMSEWGKKYPGVLAWIKFIQNQERKVEALYSQVYIGLRRWTLINEMLLEPYNKANCIAMLNTLFPPVTETTKQLTPQLTPRILKSQRDGFFRYISAIDTNGKQILDKVMMQGAREGDENGWPLVRDALGKYLRLANDVIDECSTINGPESLEPQDENEYQGRSHKGRKVDSGISFGSSETTTSFYSGASSTDILDKPLPPSPTHSPVIKHGGSALERLARELRKLGDTGKIKSLTKMRSSSALSVRSDNLPTNNSGEESCFDFDERKRKLSIWEAANRKKKAHAKQSSQHSR